MKRDIRARGQEPLAEYAYCAGCWQTISDPVSGPIFFRGFAEVGMRQLGVVDAGKRAEQFYKGLKKKK